MTPSPPASLLESYRRLLETADGWFHRCQQAHPQAIHCSSGCSACCRALFDITLLDALLLRQGFDRLPDDTRRAALARARPILSRLQDRWPDFTAPYLLNHLPDDQWMDVPDEDHTPCPLLDAQGRCLVYAHRPMICRLHGLPQVDLSGKVFSDTCCSLNFRQANPLALDTLRWSFRETYRTEFSLLQTLTAELAGRPTTEVDTFIPAALFIDLDRTDWAAALRKSSEG